jgi:hypothetical protein
MFLGLFVWLYVNKRIDLIEQIIMYGQSNRDWLGLWVMGEGDRARTVFRPNMQSTAYELLFRLSGQDHPKRAIPQIWALVDGYAAHLQAVHIYLRRMLIGRDQGNTPVFVNHYRKTYPRNALFQIVAGRTGAAIDILLDESLFPSDRLPESKDRCTEYLWQRDPGADWEPCPEERKVHAPVDFLFVAAIILGELKHVVQTEPLRREAYFIFEGDDTESSSWDPEPGHGYHLDINSLNEGKPWD